MKRLLTSPLLRPVSILLGLTLSLAYWELARQLPGALWWQSLFAPNLNDVSQAVVHFSWLPSLAVTLLAGAALGLAGTLMQQVLRNPLASPTTLGVASGAQLALMMVTLFAPSWLLLGWEWIAMAGGSLAMALVFALAWRRQLNPVVIVFAGLVINLYLAAISMGLLLFFQEELKGLLVWGSGSLVQNSWSGVSYLLPRLLAAAVLAAVLVRPLAVLELDDASARSLGVSLQHLRLAGLGLAVFVTACVVSVVGLIGFIGLAAPAMVRLLGIRQLGQRLLWAPILGALLLAATDLLLQSLSRFWPVLIPTGAMTALLGAPLLTLLAEYGLEGSYDFVPGSFCDGQYNLVIGGRKITGTAQRWLAPGQDHQGAVLAQAMLLVAGDVDEGTRMASRFYELAGGELRFMAGTSTTLASCIDWRGSDQALVEKVRARLDSLLSEGLSPPS